MAQRWSRRSFFGLTSGLPALGVSLFATRAWGQSPASPPSLASDAFPAQDPSLVREIVGVSHRDLKRVRELVERQPALARASIDWGFGDWEASSMPRHTPATRRSRSSCSRMAPDRRFFLRR